MAREEAPPLVAVVKEVMGAIVIQAKVVMAVKEVIVPQAEGVTVAMEVMGPRVAVREGKAVLALPGTGVMGIMDQASNHLYGGQNAQFN